MIGIMGLSSNAHAVRGNYNPVCTANEHTLTYYCPATANSSKTEINQLNIAFGDSVTLPSFESIESDCALPNDKKFVGWEYNGITYDAGSTFTLNVDSDIDMTVLFADNEFASISYNTNGGRINETEYSLTCTTTSTSIILPTNVLRLGYRFTGWYDDNGNKITEINKDQCVQDAKFTLNAGWTPNLINLHFNANGASGTLNAEKITYNYDGSWTPIAQGSLLKKNHVFLGWSTDENAIVPKYKAGATYTENLAEEGTVTLYAVWNECAPAVMGTGVKSATLSGVVDNICQYVHVCETGYYNPNHDTTTTQASLDCTPCTGLPDNATWTGAATTNSCEWDCNACVAGDKTTSCTVTKGANTCSYSGTCDANAFNPIATGVTISCSVCPSNSVTTYGNTATACTCVEGHSVGGTVNGNTLTTTNSCRAINYPITYHMNDGVNYSGAPSTYKFGVGTTISGTPTRDNYVFGGWCTDKDLNKCSYSQTISDTDMNAKEYWAHWMPAVCDAINGTATLSDISNNTVTCSIKCNTGYSKTGTTDATDTFDIIGGANVANISGTCSARTFNISFDANGGNGGQTSNVVATYDASMPAIAETAPVRDGYRFVGWYSSPTDGVQYYSANGTSVRAWNKTEDTTLFAHWIVGDMNTITYNINGGDINDATYTTECNVESATITLPTNVTRSGYTFDGWYNESGERITTIASGKCTTAYTFNAQWSKCGECVSGVGIESCVVDVVDNACVTSATCAEGYEQPTCVGFDCACSATEYAITYELNGGTNYTGAPTSYNVATATITLGTPTRANSNFEGWFIGSTKVTQIVTGTTGDKALVAKWACQDGYESNATDTACTGKELTLTWSNGGHGTITNAPDKCTYGETFNMPNALSATGYTFGNWSVNGLTFDANDAVICNRDNLGSYTGASIAATWSVNTYTVVYNANGGNGNMAPQTFEYDTEQNLAANTFTNSGFNFQGWATSVDGPVKYADKQGVSNLTAVNNDVFNLYAVWGTAISYTIDYQLNGGINSIFNPATYTVNDTVVFVTPEKMGYTFKGWYLDADFETPITQIALGTTGNKTLHAKWEIISLVCDAGAYLPASSTACRQCPQHSYCAGGTYTYDSDTDQGINTCPVAYPNSDLGSDSVTDCYSETKQRAWTGKQLDGTVPENCASVTQWNTCSIPACEYIAYSNANGTLDGLIKSGCETNNLDCVKTPKTVTATPDSYVDGTSCKTCSSYSETYTKSDGGEIGPDACYIERTNVGTVVTPSLPDGCAAQTLTDCDVPTCNYKDYAGHDNETCSPGTCNQIHVACTSASANYYLDNGAAKSCAIQDSVYPFSDGGTISGTECYGLFVHTGSQLEASVPENCATVMEWNSCVPGTCDYTMYQNGKTKEDCTPSDCTKTIKSVSANVNSYVDGTTCHVCPSDWPNSNGGNVSGAYCYKSCSSKAGYTLVGGVDYHTASDTCEYNANKYTVTYLCGNGTGNAPAVTDAIYDNEFVPAANTCAAPDGYKFAGWRVDNTDTIKFAGVAFTWQYTENQTMTAQWTAGDMNMVTYDSNGGTHVDGTECNVESSDIILPTDVTRTGYTFMGWYNNATDERTTVIKSGTCTAALSFTAKWEPNVYAITLDENGGTAASEPGVIYVKYDEKDAYVDRACTTPISANVTPPAKTYTITYNGNGGHVLDANITAEAVSKNQVWNFNGYFDSTTGGTKYMATNNSGAIYVTETGLDIAATYTSDHTWYAQYQEAVSNKTLLSVSAPYGYTFTGWYDAPVGGNLIGVAGDEYAAIQDVTLYAQYAASEVFCIPGYYLPKGSVTCEPCPAGHYCAATESNGSHYTYSAGLDQGITGVCKNGYNPGTNLTGTVSGNGGVHTVNLNAHTSGCYSCTYNDDKPMGAPGYAATGSKATDHDQESDCTKTITLIKEADTGTTKTTVTCAKGVECDFGGVSGTAKNGLPFTGGWGTSDTCSGNEYKFITPTGGTYYACSACSGDYETVDGVCQPCNRENATAYKPNGICQVDKCHTGYHPSGDRCVSDVQECNAPNAISATQTWDAKREIFGICLITECASGYHVMNNACVPNTESCDVEHGIGTREWNELRNAWSECIATSCDAGYTNDPYESNEPTKQCGRCRNAVGILGESAVSSYVHGCEIATCMYQGELYKLENNECVPICPIEAYSDETGTMKWNPKTKKCERECFEGYMSW